MRHFSLKDKENQSSYKKKSYSNMQNWAELFKFLSISHTSAIFERDARHSYGATSLKQSPQSSKRNKSLKCWLGSNRSAAILANLTHQFEKRHIRHLLPIWPMRVSFDRFQINVELIFFYQRIHPAEWRTATLCAGFDGSSETRSDPQWLMLRSFRSFKVTHWHTLIPARLKRAL